ncbi:MAG TPA: transposase [Bacteroidales bacterium]|nr:transposase [Bacteroidales bacterium]
MKPGTYTQMYVMLVFAVKNRKALLADPFRARIFEYIGGINTNLKNKSILVNGTANHIHVLYGMHPDVSVSDTVYHIKRGSSLYLNQSGFCHCHFSWQDGYGAFTYSRSQLDDVYQYVKNQEQHHLEISFKKEYVDLLAENDIAYEEKYLFEFFDDL